MRECAGGLPGTPHPDAQGGEPGHPQRPGHRAAPRGPFPVGFHLRGVWGPLNPSPGEELLGQREPHRIPGRLRRGQALRREPLTIYGGGSQTRSFCYVEDEVDGIWRLFNSDRVEPTNIGNPNEFTVRCRRTIPYFRELVEKDGATARTL